MDNFGVKITGVLFVVFTCFIAFIIVDFIQIKSLTNANEQLKKENYNLKVEIESLKKKELELIVKYVGE